MSGDSVTEAKLHTEELKASPRVDVVLTTSKLDPKNGTIILLGDSLLDDFNYLEDKSNDLRKELMRIGFKVNNYAVVGSKLADIINGIEPNEDCRNSRCYPYPVSDDGKVYPLKLLAQPSIKPFVPVYNEGFLSFSKPINKSKEIEMIVISAGGNNLRADVMKILLGLEGFFNGIINEEFISNYDKLIEEAKKRTDRILITSMYLPFLGPGSKYGMFGWIATPVVNRWKQFIEPFAKKHNVPVLDLSQTFDSANREHYGSTDMQPSNLSNKCIAKCIEYIYSNYNGYGVYFAPDCDASKIQLAPTDD
ncbi:Hypothetical protein HVR_LOCUS590 [uncultured virus]|nr:Hypothetical protein HVR_LOCUS590 [uncultured virus]